MKDGEKSLGKMLHILEAVSKEVGGIGSKELIKKLQLPRSTVFRMLKFLTEKDYIKTKGAVYILGNMILKLGTIAAKQNSLIRVAHPHLIELSKVTCETSHLAELQENSVVYIDKVEGSRSLRMGSMIGNSSPLQCTGIGKVILAFLNNETLKDKIKNMAFKKFTSNTIMSRKILLEELKTIRKMKVAFDRCEHEEGVFCIASPVFDCSGKVMAAVSVSGAEVYIRENTSEYAELVKNTADAISKEIGA
ncbi:MAG: Transcriptional regulator, IclR family [Candidatus Uhrbacteria bacterium GW2011_GWF2_39_13]|uniref:Transcriptional regulator, IclR family n=1 Tax=Candidatus Uhrbacteria bacterium GW2011_GWF2_39_13 TaxID=1618995 RepID=A0A0G0PYX2_9BACT|nr:MAG: Transcriptional regulator, IclR family [Candidatus Uhrbacteria bacterium GW2011_GWF2_39_13]